MKGQPMKITTKQLIRLFRYIDKDCGLETLKFTIFSIEVSEFCNIFEVNEKDLEIALDALGEQLCKTIYGDSAIVFRPMFLKISYLKSENRIELDFNLNHFNHIEFYHKNLYLLQGESK